MIATPFRLASATLLMLASLGATAQSKDIVVDGQGEVPYVVDQRNVVARSGFDLCWRTGYWTPAAAGAAKAGELPVGCQCDKDVLGADTCVPATARGVASAPAAAAATAPAAPARCDFSVNLSADSTFAFNKATLTGAAKATLDQAVIAKMGNCAAIDSLIITGHTDRLGSQGYNQKLSEKRAAAVKEYLVAKGIEANRVYTEGKGEKQPVTGDKCKGNAKTKALIDCLQPDRRVDIEVIGTK